MPYDQKQKELSKPSNWEWISRVEWANRRKTNSRLPLPGSPTLAEASRASGILSGTIRERLKRGYSPQELVSNADFRRDAEHLERRQQLASKRSNCRRFEYQGKVWTVAEIARLGHMPYKAAYKRLVTFNWSVERTLADRPRIGRWPGFQQAIE